MSKSVIIINGTRIEIEGNASNVSVVNGEVRVGGKVIQSGLSGVVKVEWSGPLASLNADGSVEVKGEVQGNVSSGGSLACWDVGGNVNAGGSVKCGKVSGSLNAGGSVRVN